MTKDNFVNLTKNKPFKVSLKHDILEIYFANGEMVNIRPGLFEFQFETLKETVSRELFIEEMKKELK